MAWVVLSWALIDFNVSLQPPYASVSSLNPKLRHSSWSIFASKANLSSFVRLVAQPIKNIHIKNNIRGSNILIKLEYIYKALIGKYNMEDRFNDATNNDNRNNDYRNNDNRNNDNKKNVYKNIKYL